ncbi:hypothetical protein FWK35_00029375 [Aphis craccivora]|nr:hypothetical protein FWK35_00029375 [Aphis craccivora]
MNLLVH